MQIKETIFKNGSIGVIMGKGPFERIIEVSILTDDIEKSLSEPYELKDFGRGDLHTWLYKNKAFYVSDCRHLSDDEVKLRIKHFVLKKEKETDKISKEVEAFENFDKTQTAKRERIPDQVRLFVWQRDEGKCAKCGNKEKLEFDHIIPFVEGGSNTERNIQLLCENCNRSKGKSI